MGAFICFCAFVNCIIGFVNFCRWLKSTRLRTRVLRRLAWSTRLPPSSISLLHADTKLVWVRHNWRMLYLLLGKWPQMMCFIINFSAYYLIIGWFGAIINIQRSLSTILSLGWILRNAMLIGLLSLYGVELFTTGLLIHTLTSWPWVVSYRIILYFYTFKVLLIYILLLVFHACILALWEVYLLLVLY